MTAANLASFPMHTSGGQGTYGDPVPIGAMGAAGNNHYDASYPVAVNDPSNAAVVHQDVPGSNPGNWPEATASFAYITPSEGGVAGDSMRNGWSTGLAKLDRNIHHFTGRAVRFVRRDLSKDTGPVGQSNYQGKLTAGVGQQTIEYPSLQDIANSFVNHG